MPTAVAAGLARSRACDGTDAVSDIRPAGRVDGAAGAFGGVEGRRAAGAAPGGRGAAAAEPQAEAGLGRPGGPRCPGAAAPEAAAGEPPGHAGHAAALAPASGPLAAADPARAAAQPRYLAAVPAHAGPPRCWRAISSTSTAQLPCAASTCFS